MASGGEELCEKNDWSMNKEEQTEEITALESIFEDTLTIMSRPDVTDEDEDNNALFTMKMDIPIALPRKDIRVDVWAPYEYDVDSCQQIHSGIPSSTRPNFCRSESGKRWHSSFNLTALTPLCLVITLPQSYPSERCPEFSLSCAWLDYLQLSVLCQQLDELWGQSAGMPVIYTWIDWLQNNTLSHLALEKCVILTPYIEEDESRDSRALPECDDLRETLVTMLQHDYLEEKKAFLNSIHSCGICFDEKPGMEFFRLDRCHHHFCQDCMRGHCDTHVKEGTVQKLQCPDHDCDEQIPPDVLRTVLGEEAFLRWERLILQKGLESMGDIEYCPRCQMPVIKEPDTQLDLAHCTNCMYSFCTQCKDNWHAGQKCASIEEKLKKLAESSKNKPDKQDDAKSLRLLKMEYLNIAAVRKISKPCPNCQADIQKDGGCNKVTCIKCGNQMCWMCGKKIKGYEHFDDTRCGIADNEAAVLNRVPQRERHEGAVNVERCLMEDPNARQNVIKCPRCHQNNIKENRNNHLKCWCCKSNFCYQCKTCIIGPVMQHFTAGKHCDQHSD